MGGLWPTECTGETRRPFGLAYGDADRQHVMVGTCGLININHWFIVVTGGKRFGLGGKRFGFGRKKKGGKVRARKRRTTLIIRRRRRPVERAVEIPTTHIQTMGRMEIFGNTGP